MKTEIKTIEFTRVNYRVLYNTDIEYQISDEAIKETIEANEYEFYSNGKLI